MRRHFTSRTLNTAGQFQVVDAYGPHDFKEWSACFMVFLTLGIMFKFISGGWLRADHSIIQEADQHYPEAWGGDLPNGRENS